MYVPVLEYTVYGSIDANVCIEYVESTGTTGIERTLIAISVRTCTYWSYLYPSTGTGTRRASFRVPGWPYRHNAMHGWGRWGHECIALSFRHWRAGTAPLYRYTLHVSAQHTYRYRYT